MSNVYTIVQKLDKHRCRAWGCGQTTGLQIHHIIPRSQGGGDKIENLITLCEKHHNMVTTRKMTNVELLIALKKKRDFRWQKSLNWHINREDLQKIKEK